MVFVLNIGRMIDISNIPNLFQLLGLCRSCRVKRGCDLLTFKRQDQKIAACGSSYRGYGLRPDTKWLTSLNPGVDACPGVTSESIKASSSAVIFTACALV